MAERPRRVGPRARAAREASLERGSTLGRIHAQLAPLLPGARLAPSRFGHGTAVWFGATEILHAHAGSEVDIRLPRPLRRSLLAIVEPADERPRASWVAVRVVRPHHVAAVCRSIVEAYGATKPR
jgi:hypothetical protein